MNDKIKKFLADATADSTVKNQDPEKQKKVISLLNELTQLLTGNAPITAMSQTMPPSTPASRTAAKYANLTRYGNALAKLDQRNDPIRSKLVGDGFKVTMDTREKTGFEKIGKDGQKIAVIRKADTFQVMRRGEAVTNWLNLGALDKTLSLLQK